MATQEFVDPEYRRATEAEESAAAKRCMDVAHDALADLYGDGTDESDDVIRIRRILVSAIQRVLAEERACRDELKATAGMRVGLGIDTSVLVASALVGHGDRSASHFSRAGFRVVQLVAVFFAIEAAANFNRLTQDYDSPTLYPDETAMAASLLAPKVVGGAA